MVEKSLKKFPDVILLSIILIDVTLTATTEPATKISPPIVILLKTCKLEVVI